MGSWRHCRRPACNQGAPLVFHGCWVRSIRGARDGRRVERGLAPGNSTLGAKIDGQDGPGSKAESSRRRAGMTDAQKALRRRVEFINKKSSRANHSRAPSISGAPRSDDRRLEVLKNLLVRTGCRVGGPGSQTSEEGLSGPMTLRRKGGNRGRVALRALLLGEVNGCRHLPTTRACRDPGFRGRFTIWRVQVVVTGTVP